MTGRILIVDDLDLNLKLLETRLHAEYFDVVAARSGSEALRICAEEPIDLVLLDIMMPGMDGYQVCRRLKSDVRTRHIPVILVTALDLPADRVTGLEAGADDFLTKPVRDLQLFSRVKSLLRLKLLTDELRIRADTTATLLGDADLLAELSQGGRNGQILVVDDGQETAERLRRMLSGEHRCRVASKLDQVSEAAPSDLVVLNLASKGFDPLRTCSQLRSNEATRQIPILLVANEEDEQTVAKALDLGANDYILRPIDRNELMARVRTQINRRRYDEGLRKSLRTTIEMAAIDSLTTLQNRRFLDAHLPVAIERAMREGRPLAVLIADIDHFKQINDRFGHDAGDKVLQGFARRLKDGSRASDLVCRMGGEEFVVVMPDTDDLAAASIAERLRQRTSDKPFAIGEQELSVTVSVGLSILDPRRDDAVSLLKRADRGLYEAKRKGRNRVEQLAA